MKTSDQNIITTKILSKRQRGHYLMLTRNSMDIYNKLLVKICTFSGYKTRVYFVFQERHFNKIMICTIYIHVFNDNAANEFDINLNSVSHDL